MHRLLLFLSFFFLLAFANPLDFTSPKADEKVSNIDDLEVTIDVDAPTGASWLLAYSRCGSDGWTQFMNISNPSIDYSYTEHVSRENLYACMNQDYHLLASIIKDNASYYNTTLTVHVLGNGLEIMYVVCSSVSVLCCTVLIILYFVYPTLRQFPSNLIFWRTIVDLVLSILLIILNSHQLIYHRSDNVCTLPLAYFTQFCLSASMAWYFVLGLNFFFSITNPFRRPASKTARYHIAVWVFSFATAAITATDYEYRQDFHICWNAKTSGINVLNWVGFFMWIILFDLAAVIALLHGVRRLSGGKLDKTLETRGVILYQTRVYIIVFSVYWGIAAGVWYAVFLESQDYKQIQDPALSYTFALIVGCVGIVDAVVWIGLQWPTLKSAMKSGNKDKEEFDDISSTLRYDFIEAIQKGILQSLGQSSENPTGKAFQSNGDTYINLGTRGQKKVLPQDPRTRNLKYDIEGSSSFFTVYEYEKFAALREAVGLSPDIYRKSIEGDVTNMKKKFSEGASGSFFFFTQDERYLIKTMEEEEFRVILSIMEPYTEHMKKYPNSLLCRFLGVYSIFMYHHYQYIAVMNNINYTNYTGRPYKLNLKYDLKGSRISRHGKHKPGQKGVPTLKDNDLHRKVHLEYTRATEVVTQLKKDAEFLRNRGIMDYSLLLCIHNCTEHRATKQHCNAKKKSHYYLRTASLYPDAPSPKRAAPSLSTPTSTSSSSSSSASSSTSSESSPSGETGTQLTAVASDEPKLDEKENSITSASIMPKSPSLLGGEVDSPIIGLAPLRARVIIGPGIYHLGIIDMLQTWTWEKKLEQLLKRVFRGHWFDYKWISAVEPGWYCDRFCQMVDRTFVLPPSTESSPRSDED